MWGVPRGAGLPADSFAVVMATGIVSVAARDNGHPTMSVVLAVLAGVQLGVLAVLAAARLATTGRAFAAGPDALTRTFGLFTFVAACDVVDARLGGGVPVVAGALWLVALVGWLLIVSQLWAALRSVPRRVLRDTARGSWLLAAVATHSLALTAAQLARGGVATALLLGVALAGWVLGLLAYVVITVAVVRRLLAARFVPEVLTPDTWVLMGALAIGTVSGATLFLAARESGAFGWLPALMGPVLFAVWVVGSAWIPLLVAGEAWRARRVRLRYERTRWSTVFPLGMYSSACSILAVVLATAAGADAALPAALRGLSHVVYWVAVAAGCGTAFGLARLGLRAARATTAR